MVVFDSTGFPAFISADPALKLKIIDSGEVMIYCMPGKSFEFNLFVMCPWF
jgi:hypothetical protein